MRRWFRRAMDAFWRWRMERRIGAMERRVHRPVAQVNKGLARMAERISQLKQQLRDQEQQVAHLREQVQKHLDAGERDAARRAVLDLKRTEEACQSTQSRLREAEETYQEVLRQRDATLRQVEEEIGRARGWLERMEYARLREDLADLAASVLGRVNGTVQLLAGMERAFISRVAAAEAEAIMAHRRLAGQAPDEDELADMLLEEFEARQQRRLTEEVTEEEALLLDQEDG